MPLQIKLQLGFLTPMRCGVHCLPAWQLLPVWHRHIPQAVCAVLSGNVCVCCVQVAEAQSLLANTSSLVEQQLQLPAHSCAVITNGRVLWVHDPKEPDSVTPGRCCWRLAVASRLPAVRLEGALIHLVALYPHTC